MKTKSFTRLMTGMLMILAICVVGLPLVSLLNSCKNAPKGVEITQTAKVQVHDYTNAGYYSFETISDDYFAPYVLETTYKNDGKIICTTIKFGTFKKLDSIKCIEYDFVKKMGDSLIEQTTREEKELEILNTPCK